METVKKKVRRKAYIDPAQCVACGCCVKVCPRDAIAIVWGATAQVDTDACIGCGKCAKECPASIITLWEVQA